MNLFELKNNKVTFSPQALTLKPIKEIWDNDLSEDKFQAMAELSYVYYMADDRSDYQYIIDKEERHDTIVSEINGLDANWVLPTYVEEALEFYKKASETTSTRLLRSTRGVVDKISHFLDIVDVNERDQKTGKPIFDINKVVVAVEKIPKLVKALSEIEKEVVNEKELRAQSGNREVGVFDDDGI